jgi:hypothetical protein
MGVKVWRTRILDSTEWKLSLGKKRPNLNGCSGNKKKKKKT